MHHVISLLAKHMTIKIRVYANLYSWPLPFRSGSKPKQTQEISLNAPDKIFAKVKINEVHDMSLKVNTIPLTKTEAEAQRGQLSTPTVMEEYQDCFDKLGCFPG